MIRKLKRALKIKRVKQKNIFHGSRYEMVMQALSRGLCVDCGHLLKIKGSDFYCPSCHWEGKTGNSLKG